MERTGPADERETRRAASGVPRIPVGVRVQSFLLMTMTPLIKGLLAVLGWLVPERLIPTLAWPRPSGVFAVGVEDALLLDGPGLRLEARIWYPATPVAGRPTRQLYTEAEALALAESLGGLTSAPCRRRLLP